MVAEPSVGSWRPRNDRRTCVCGTPRQDIPNHIYKPVPYVDASTPAYFYRCEACGTLSAVNLYFNVESYSRVPISAFSIPDLKRLVNRTRVEWIRSRVGPEFPQNPVVYDLGSGEGCFTSCFLETFPEARLIAVETDERMKEKFSDEYCCAEFVPELIEVFLERAAANPEADLILLTDVLEHVLEPELLLQLIAGALKPSGFAYITVPNVESYGDFPHHVGALEVDWELANWTCQHLWMMHPRVLNSMVSRQFVIREMSRSFEEQMRRDADYSTFLVQPLRERNAAISAYDNSILEPDPALERPGPAERRVEIVSPLDTERPVGWEARKSYASKIASGFFSRYLSGSKILEIGYKGYGDGVVPILPHAIGIDLDYPDYDGVTLPFLDESQDAVYTSHCLEHINDYKRAIQEWFRVVRRGGHIVIVVPHQYLYERRREIPSRWNSDHKRFYTPASLLREIEEVLEPNSYRIRHLIDNDFGFDYSIPPRQGSVGCQEIELVLEKIPPPFWTLDGDLFSAADFRSQLPVERPSPFILETNFSVSDDCLAYGPYVRLPTGEHEATFHVKAIGLGEQGLASPITFDVGQDAIRIASVELLGLEGSNLLRNETVALRFDNNAPESVFEFRIYASGRPFQGTFVFFGVSLRRL